MAIAFQVVSLVSMAIMGAAQQPRFTCLRSCNGGTMTNGR